MKMITEWVAVDGKRFNTIAECQNHEGYIEALQKRIEENSPKAIFEKLVQDLERVQVISPDCIFTCSFDSVRIKGMVRVCQSFAEKYKEYLNYY